MIDLRNSNTFRWNKERIFFPDYFWPLSLFVFFFICGCGKDEQPPIDVGYVNLTIYPNSTEYIQLNSPGGYVYLYAEPPSRGIIAYRLSSNEFKAYERTPTYKKDNCGIYNRVIVDESGFFYNWYLYQQQVVDHWWYCLRRAGKICTLPIQNLLWWLYPAHLQLVYQNPFKHNRCLHWLHK